jgi:thioredoxin reductase
MTSSELPVAVIGAGPSGLAAAAHLLAKGEIPLVLEQGPGPGTNIRQWGHVAMFSPWEFNTDKAAAALLTAHGWRHPRMDALPTGQELVELYLEPLAALPAMRSHVRYATRVIGVARKGQDKVRSKARDEQPFVLRVIDAAGTEAAIEARAVIDASGTWGSPNPAGADGLPALGEHAAAARVAYGIPDILGTARGRYAGKRVMVVGGGHSALNALIELAELPPEVAARELMWIMRKPDIETAYGGESADALPARGALGAQARQLVEGGAVRAVSPFRIERITSADDGGLTVTGDHAGRPGQLAADEIIVATGFRPDLSFLREIRLSLDTWLESSGTIGPLIDPNLHSCGTVRPHGARELAHAEADFFIIGMKSYGRAPTFLLATGHEQARSVVAALSGDMEAAERVELVLPETGVCSTRPIASRVAALSSSCCVQSPAKASCCGTVPEPAAVEACCAPSCRTA